jgi:hypothetical protein
VDIGDQAGAAAGKYGFEFNSSGEIALRFVDY